MKKIFLIFCLFSINLVHASTYSLWCRGPVSFKNTLAYSVTFDFEKSLFSALNPHKLLPGTCAWEDRGLGMSEPSTVVAALFDPTNSDPATLIVRSTNFLKDVAILTNALSTSENLLNIQVQSEGGVLTVPLNPAARYFKTLAVKK